MTTVREVVYRLTAQNNLSPALAMIRRDFGQTGATAAATTDKAAKETKRWATALSEVANIVTGVRQGLLLVRDASRAAFEGTLGAVVKYGAEVDKIQKSADVLRVPVEELQKLEFAAERSGVGIEAFRTAMAFTGRTLRAELIANVGKAGSAVDKFDASVRATLKKQPTGGGLSGNLLGSLQQLQIDVQEFDRADIRGKLGLVADAFVKWGAGAEAAAAVSRIFGEETGQKLVPLLQNGREGVEALVAEAEALGFVFDEETGRAAEALTDQMTNLGRVWMGLKTAALGPLLPVVRQFVQRVQTWVQANKELIASKVTEWGTQFFRAVENGLPLLKDLVGSVTAFVEGVKTLTTEWGDWVKTLVASFVAVKTARVLVLSLQAAVAALGTAGPASSMTALVAAIGGPAGLVVALAAALPLAVQLGDAFGDWIAAQEKIDKISGNRIIRGRRTTLGDQIASANVARSRTSAVGTIVGQENFAREIAKMTVEEQDKFFQDLERRRDFQFGADRALGGLKSRANQLRRERLDREEDAADRKAIAVAEAEIDAAVAERRLIRRRSVAAAASGKKDEPVTDAELAKLIESAAKTGQNLDAVLGGRKIAGGVPPVITVTVNTNNYETNVELTQNIDAQNADAQQVVEISRREATTVLQREVDRVVRQLTPAEAV